MDTVGKMSRYVKEHQMDVKVIGIPKTIDNDIYGTDMTFGFQSAVNIATNAIDCIHTTASSHGRVFIVEVMGHKVGSLTLHAGVAGGADIILIPEPRNRAGRFRGTRQGTLRPRHSDAERRKEDNNPQTGQCGTPIRA